jgi:hypothetical protein
MNTTPAPETAPDETPKPWRAEVTVTDDAKWYSNALRFATKEEALSYASDLSGRWMQVTRWRAVDETVPANQAYEAGTEDGSWL